MPITLSRVLPFLICVFLFIREIRLEHKKQLEAKWKGNEQVLREVALFLEGK